MALVTNINRRGVDAGRFTPHADQREFRSSWAVVEGNASPGWRGVNEHIDGIERGQGREKLLKYTEFKGRDGKFHEIHYGNMRLREMVCKVEDADEATRFEAMQSEERVTNEERNKQQEELGQHYSKNIESTYEGITQQYVPPTQEPKRGGRPKGSRNKPKLSGEPSPE